MLGRAPGFSLAAVLMLAIGTGANAAIFSVIDAVLLRPAAIDPSRIVEVEEQTAARPPAAFRSRMSPSSRALRSSTPSPAWVVRSRS